MTECDQFVTTFLFFQMSVNYASRHQNQRGEVGEEAACEIV